MSGSGGQAAMPAEPGGGLGGGGASASAGAVGEAGGGNALGPLPAPWLERDVGQVGLLGETRYVGGVFVTRGAGLEIYHQQDQFHFTYLPLVGDGAIEARVAYVENTATYATAGVMFRMGSEVDSPAVMVRYAIGQGIFWSGRTTAGERWNEPGDIQGRGGSLPIWVRLERSGSDINGSFSADGSTWTSLPGIHIDGATPSMNVGIAVNSQHNDVACTAVLDHVRISNADGTVWQAEPPLAEGLDLVPKETATPGPHCPVGGQPGAGADCARLCECLAARCGGSSDDGHKCMSLCGDFSLDTCQTACLAGSEARLCCRAGACTQTFHEAAQCSPAFEGAGCAN